MLKCFKSVMGFKGTPPDMSNIAYKGTKFLAYVQTKRRKLL